MITLNPLMNHVLSRRTKDEYNVASLHNYYRCCFSNTKKRIKRIEDCIFHQEYNKETEENNGKN